MKVLRATLRDAWSFPTEITSTLNAAKGYELHYEAIGLYVTHKSSQRKSLVPSSNVLGVELIEEDEPPKKGK